MRYFFEIIFFIKYSTTAIENVNDIKNNVKIIEDIFNHNSL